METTAHKESVESVGKLIDEAQEDAQKDKYLLFSIGNESYGIDISCITEIIVMQNITEVPDMPESIMGVINLRGKVISVIDARRRFRMEPRKYDDKTCIIVVDINSLTVGLIVDTVNEVADIPENRIDPPPRTHSGMQSNYIKGMGKQENDVKILLNVDSLLFEEEFEQIN